MRVVSSRRTRPFLLILALVTLGAAEPVLAKTPYAINDALEGDPGDGVLRPVAPEDEPVGVPGGTDPVCGTPDADVDAAAAGPAPWPRMLWVPTLGWLSFAAVWWAGAGRWQHAP